MAGFSRPALDDLMDLLLSVSCRWMWIRLQLPASDLQRLRRLSLSDLSVLQTIELAATPIYTEHDDFGQHPLDFLAAPSIRSVVLYLGCLMHSTMLPVPWDQLTELSLVANNLYRATTF